MGTLAELKARIQVELWNRTDLDDQIALAIERAIEAYADTRFWFNTNRLTAPTVAANAYLTLPTGLRVVDAAYITVGGSSYELTAQPETTIEDSEGVVASGQPTDYAIRGSQARLYPTPNAIYSVAFLGIYDLDALDDDSDSNAWTTEAQDLIAARSCAWINSRILNDADAAQAAAAEEGRALSELNRKTARKLGTGRIQPSM